MVMEKMMKLTIAGILAVIGILIGFVVLPPVIVALFPIAVAGIVQLATLGNFTFATLFTATGLFPLLLSTGIFLVMLSIVIVAIVYIVSLLKTGKGR